MTIVDEIRSPIRSAIRSPLGPSRGTTFALDATAASIRAAILDPASYASGGWRLPGLAGARLSASARASVAMQQRVDGGWEFAPHNLLTQSETLDNADWSKLNGAVTADAAASPFGGNSADVFVESAASGRHMLFRTIATVSGQVVSASIYAKASTRRYLTVALKNVAGSSPRFSTTFDLLTGAVAGGDSAGSPSGTASSIQGVASGYYRVAVAMQAAGPNTNIEIGLSDSAAPSYSESIPSYTGDGTSSLILFGGQFNLGPAATAYIPTTTTAVYGPAIDWLSGIGAYGLRSEEQRVNLALWSRDLTQTVWTKTSATAALTATGIDGVANAASVLTATAANATALQAITDASAARTLTIYLRRRTGTGTVETTIDGGTTWVARTLTAAWQPFSTTATLANPNIGIRIVTSGDAVDVDAAQCEAGAFATSPILTYGASATRAADAPFVPVSAPALGSIIVNLQVPSSRANARGVWLRNPATGAYVDFLSTDINAGVARLEVQASSVSQAVRTVSAAGTDQRIAAAFAGGDFALSYNGSAASTQATGTVPASMTEMDLGWSPDGLRLNGHITRLRYATRRMSNAELQALTA